MMRFVRVILVALSAAGSGCGLILPNTELGDLDLFFNGPVVTSDLVAPDEPVFVAGSLFDAIPGKVGSHAPTLTAFGDGELLAAWYSYTGPHELTGSAIYLSRRAAGSDRWNVPELLIDRPCGVGNPVLYSEGDDVWLFHAVVPFGWDTSHIEVQRSADRGVTWEQAGPVSFSLGSNTRFPPVRSPEGALLLPAYDDLLGRSLFFESTDGEYWRFLAAVSSGLGNIQPSLARVSNDRLLAVMRNTEGNWLWVMASDDGGRTWCTPIDSGLPNPGSPAMLLALADGKLVLIFNDSRSQRRPLSIALSTDDGQTWPYRRILADGDGKYSYPAAVEAADGVIHILFTASRQTIQHVALNTAWIISSQ